MPKIKLITHVNAPIEKCFDLARSVDVHEKSTQQTNEKAIAGKTSGLLDLNDTVTWRARHFGIYQKLTSKITEFKRPDYFVDEMVQGPFRKLYHKHEFKKDKRGNTIMTDHFEYVSPFWIFGKLADIIFLKRYMLKLLEQRNEVIKTIAEENSAL